MRQTLDEYIEGRLGCGSVVLVIFGIIAAIVLVPIMFDGFLEELKYMWSAWLYGLLMVVASVTALITYSKSTTHTQRNMGIALIINAIAAALAAVFVFSKEGVLMGALFCVLVVAEILIALHCFAKAYLNE